MIDRLTGMQYGRLLILDAAQGNLPQKRQVLQNESLQCVTKLRIYIKEFLVLALVRCLNMQENVKRNALLPIF